MDFWNNNNGSPPCGSEISIPGRKCGWILGKNGENIKRIQHSLGVKMILIQECSSPTEAPKLMHISGTAENVEQAKRVIEWMLKNETKSVDVDSIIQLIRHPRSNSQGSDSQVATDVFVPRSAAGIIIGRGGSTIRRLNESSGASAQFRHDENPSSPERCMVIEGTEAQITHATSLIWNLVQYANQMDRQSICRMSVPTSKAGLVFGYRGKTINSISHKIGVRIDSLTDQSLKSEESIFTIKGTPYQIHLAKHEINVAIGKVAPGTQAPPFGKQAAESASCQRDYAPQWEKYCNSR